MATKHVMSLLLTLFMTPAFAAGLAPFQTESLTAIENARAGKPFILMLWSLDCPPCMREFEVLQRQRDRIPPSALVLISTDSEAQQSEIETMLERFGMTAFENWVFADHFVERLRYVIDPQWFGELPRAYLYAASHQRTAKSGLMSGETLEVWLQTLTQESPREATHQSAN